MNLISCDGCGVVFDADKLKFPDHIWDEEKGYDMSKCDYVYDPGRGEKNFIPFIICSICGERIYIYRS